MNNNNLEKKIALCPGEGGIERTFERVDEGISLLGLYQCTYCKKVYDESFLTKDYVDLIKKKIKKK